MSSPSRAMAVVARKLNLPSRPVRGAGMAHTSSDVGATRTSMEEIAAAMQEMVVSLEPAAKYKRPAWRLSQEQKDLDERLLRASQWPSHP